MAGDSISVSPQDLISHANRVNGAAEQVATARRAGEAVRLGGHAYGHLCVMVPVLLGGLQDLVVDGIAAAERSLHDTGDRLRRTAEAYRAADEHSAQMLDRIGRD
jgi:uncharacterized protein YukE